MRIRASGYVTNSSEIPHKSTSSSVRSADRGGSIARDGEANDKFLMCKITAMGCI
jgi:hypothetical protein